MTMHSPFAGINAEAIRAERRRSLRRIVLVALCIAAAALAGQFATKAIANAAATVQQMETL